MNSPAEQKSAPPAGLLSAFQKTVSQKLYPPDLYPRQWYPDLDAIVSGLFNEAWETDPDFRNGLVAAGETRFAEMIAAEFSLPSILARHPRALIMIYRQLISGFISRLHRRQDERADIIQEIFARLLSGKLAKIQNRFDIHFKETSHFTSYFMVCIRNMYVDIVREGGNLRMKRDDVPLQVLEKDTSGRGQPCQTAFLEEEFAKLRIILQLHASSRGKLTLCLKLKCRYAVTAADATRCFPDCSADDVFRLSADFRCKKDRDMYRAVVPVFNRHEGKPVQADTLRKWVENKTNLLIAHLNRLHREAVYDNENIADLLALFFAEENTHDRK